MGKLSELVRRDYGMEAQIVKTASTTADLFQLARGSLFF